MAEIVIVVGHPRSSTYCEALAAAYRRGAEAGGHRARVIALSRMRFDPILHEGFSGQQTASPAERLQGSLVAHGGSARFKRKPSEVI